MTGEKAELPETALQDQSPTTTFVRASEMDVDASSLPSETLAKRLDNAIKQIERGDTDCDWLEEAADDLLADTERLRDLAAQYEYEERDES
jgi:hypothetical protein